MLRLSLMVILLGVEVSAPEPAVREVVVPKELAAVTSNPEFSGIVWSPTLKRYFVVTDDSGLRGKGTNHEPLVLSLREDGVLDERFIPVKGVDSLNDPESICAGPDGSFFIVTSHSPNKKEQTPKSRRQLLQVKEVKRTLKVVGKLDLTESKDGRSLLSLAGLPESGRLDIEAITYYKGALYIGFKSPLTPAGEAVIVRFVEPEKALQQGKIGTRAIERFLMVSLSVEGKKQQVGQGISDMTFLSDGSLVLTANAPKGGPKDHGGALWLLSAPVEKAKPFLLRRFHGLKPEGVTLAPDGRNLTIVFDCDQNTPKWTQVPLPAVPGRP
jgi:hypothetical protein